MFKVLHHGSGFMDMTKERLLDKSTDRQLVKIEMVKPLQFGMSSDPERLDNLLFK